MSKHRQPPDDPRPPIGRRFAVVLSIALAAVAYLTYVNFDDKLWGSVASVLFGWLVALVTSSVIVPKAGSRNGIAAIVLGGICSMLVATAGSLKETRMVHSFPTPVLFDSKTNYPYFLVAREPRQKVRQFDYSAIATRAGPTGVRVGPPATDDKSRDSYCLELIEYTILNRIQLLGATRRGVHKLLGGRGPGIFEADVNNFYELPDERRLTSQQLAAGFAQNRFLNALERTDNGWFVPEGTRIYTSHDTSTPIEKRTIHIERPSFFHVAIEITPLGSSYDSGFVPPNFDAGADWKRISTRDYEIRITSTFEMWSSWNRKMDEYKGWTKWLLDDIEARYPQ